MTDQMVAKIGDKLVTILKSDVTIHSKQKIVTWRGSCIVLDPDLDGKEGTLLVVRQEKPGEEWVYAGDIGKIEFKLPSVEFDTASKLESIEIEMLLNCNKELNFYEYEIKVTKVLK